MSTKISIKLNVAGKSYPMTIDSDKEERCRRAEREVNRLVEQYQSRFRAQPEDYLAMSALQLAIANIEHEMDKSLGDDIDALMDIDRELDDYINGLGE